MTFIIICLIVFGFGVAGLCIETVKKPTIFKVVASIVFLLVYGSAIVWALNRFVN